MNLDGPVNPDGLVVVDKPGGMTSHDVVARVRRLARTRRVGHGGTLDPMATGVLVVALGRATRLLTYVSGSAKGYLATVRLGQSTVTDDAEGEVVTTGDVSGTTDQAIRAGLGALTGEIDQVPSAVSAIKIDGRRAYKRVRDGEQVVLAARRITVSRLEAIAIRRNRLVPGVTHDGAWSRELRTTGHGPGSYASGQAASVVDVDVEVTCSSGTYVRAIARDLGAGLGVGGHLTALRRTAVGAFTLAEAVSLPELESRAPDVVAISLAEAASRIFARRDATAEETRVLSHGGPLAAAGIAEPYAVFAPGGSLLAVVSERAGRARPEVVFVG